MQDYPFVQHLHVLLDGPREITDLVDESYQMRNVSKVVADILAGNFIIDNPILLHTTKHHLKAVSTPPSDAISFIRLHRELTKRSERKYTSNFKLDTKGTALRTIYTEYRKTYNATPHALIALVASHIIPSKRRGAICDIIAAPPPRVKAPTQETTLRVALRYYTRLNVDVNLRSLAVAWKHTQDDLADRLRSAKMEMDTPYASRLHRTVLQYRFYKDTIISLDSNTDLRVPAGRIGLSSDSLVFTRDDIVLVEVNETNTTISGTHFQDEMDIIRLMIEMQRSGDAFSSIMRKIGSATLTCMHCLRALTSPESISRGTGPHCQLIIPELNLKLPIGVIRTVVVGGEDVASHIVRNSGDAPTSIVLVKSALGASDILMTLREILQSSEESGLDDNQVDAHIVAHIHTHLIAPNHHLRNRCEGDTRTAMEDVLLCIQHRKIRIASSYTETNPVQRLMHAMLIASIMAPADVLKRYAALISRAKKAKYMSDIAAAIERGKDVCWK